MNNVMLDLETMGSGPNAAIVAIGAVEFDPAAASLGRHFHRVVHLASAMAAGGEIDPATVLWWMRQSDDARSAIASDDTEASPILEALADFAAWIQQADPNVAVWGNGSDFDNVVLAQAFRRVGMPVPWFFRNNRCYRTMKAMRPDVKLQRCGAHHNALDDAESQALHLMAILTAPPLRIGDPA